MYDLIKENVFKFLVSIPVFIFQNIWRKFARWCFVDDIFKSELDQSFTFGDKLLIVLYSATCQSNVFRYCVTKNDFEIHIWYKKYHYTVNPEYNS